MQNNEISPQFYFTRKINLQWNKKNINGSPETIKFLEGNIEGKPSDMDFGNDFF